MDQIYTDEMYTILDEMNSQIEDMVNSCNETGKAEMAVAKLGQKTREFVDTFQEELEKIELIESEF